MTLAEQSKEEWWDVVRELKPGITWEQFEIKWAEFSALKKSKGKH